MIEYVLVRKEIEDLLMAGKKSKNKTKKAPKPGMDREKRRLRNMQYVFLGISVILILSMLLAATAR